MYCLNKFIGWVVSPVGLALVLLAAAGALALFGRPKCRVRAKWLAVSAGAWLWLWSTPLMTKIAGATLEGEFLSDGRVPDAESYPSADAILLLGGGMDADTNLSSRAEMWASADRVWMAADLWKAGKAPKVVATGGRVEQSTCGLLTDLGVPREAIAFDDGPRNTEEEARAAAREDGRVLVVTSAWHMRRAMLMFRKYAPNVEAIPAPSDFENTLVARSTPPLLWLAPTPQALAGNTAAFREWLGYWGYRLFR